MFYKVTALSLAVLSTSVSAANVAVYGQCGGKGWTGGTVCAAGSTCTYSNDYYSQCLPGAAQATTKAASTTKATTSVKASTTASSSKASTPSPVGGSTYKASFTQYGSTDTWGSGNCNTATTACGFYTYPGYSAAVSQNEFGVGPGAGAGPGCGTCWKLTANTDSNGKALSNAGNTIVVQVTNLCPAQGNPLCAQNGLTGTNQYGANLNFDLCIDSGASAALFGNSGVGLAVGSAVQVDCSAWSGTVKH